MNMQIVAKLLEYGNLKIEGTIRRPIMFPSHRKTHRLVNIYDSELCLLCTACIGKDLEEQPVESRLVPVNPEIYVKYLCTSCFIDSSVDEVVTQIRTFVLTEKDRLEEQLSEWKLGRTQDPLRFLEHSVKFLKGHRADPPFKCAVFSLHERYIKGYPLIKHHGHLTLISFD
jgi:hypothetical protein